MTKLTKKIAPFVEAVYPILYIDSFEEYKVDEAIEEIKDEMNYKIETWSVTSGESLVDFLKSFAEGIEDLQDILIVLKDIHYYLDKSHNQYEIVIEYLKKLSMKILNDDDATANIIIVSPVTKIPVELEKFITIFELELPDFNEIKSILDEMLEDEIDEKTKELLANILKGLTETEISLLINLLYQSGNITDIKASEKFVLAQKEQIIKKNGILEMVKTNENMDGIGGLENLKTWLTKKAKVFSNIKEAKKFGVDIPKGVFIVGMPGCGKSLTAKATSILFNNIPLLRLDIGRLMGKYVGESESNMRKAIKQAEAISPSILWIDEIEKAFNGIGQAGGSEVTSRLFGYFLTWMQEKTSEVYVVATANDISNLPPELLRKGRFDEVFFVDFPNENERKDIFKVHIKNRNHSFENVDISKLAKQTKGYSGADIETVVKETIENCFVENKQPTTKDYEKVIEDVVSISEMLKKQIENYNKLKKELKMKSASKK